MRRAMTHIWTVMNEEIEKKVPKARGLLNKLLRTADVGIRRNLLKHHFQPSEVATVPGLDDESDDLSDLTVVGGTSLVSPKDFSDVLVETIQNVRTDDEEMKYEIIEKIRAVAKETRVIIGE